MKEVLPRVAHDEIIIIDIKESEVDLLIVECIFLCNRGEGTSFRNMKLSLARNIMNDLLLILRW